MSVDGRGKKKENMKAVCAVWTLLCVGCMTAMLLFASRKTVVIADVSGKQSGLPEGAGQQDRELQSSELLTRRTDNAQGFFYIPLPKGLKAGNVVMENRYPDRELWLYIQSSEQEFYGENEIAGDISPILSGSCEEREDGILLKLRMERILEYKSTMEGSGLTVAWYEPHDVYEYVVVLDPAGGGDRDRVCGAALEEKDLTLQVARLIQKGFAMQNVRLYLTRADDAILSPRDRIALAEEAGADLYIRLCAAADMEKPESYGIKGIYNETYFIPEFGNVDLADFLTRETAVASSNRALGLEAAGDDSILRELKIPAAELSLGYLSNPREEALLGRESYQEKLATGVLSAILKAVDALSGDGAQAID